MEVVAINRAMAAAAPLAAPAALDSTPTSIHLRVTARKDQNRAVLVIFMTRLV